MKKCDDELFSLKGQRNSNEDDEKQRQNLFGVLRTQVVEQLDMTRELTDDELYASIDEVLMMPQYRKQFSVRVLTQLRQALYDSFRRLDVLSEALDDPEVTEIMVNGYDQIYVEKQGELVRFPKAFSSQEKLEDVIQQIVAKVNRRVNEANPMADARLEDGSRVNIILPPIALNGPILTIRRFAKHPPDMHQLIKWGALSEDVAQFLANLVRARYNIFISGGTGSGKTTVVRKIIESLPPGSVAVIPQDSYYNDQSSIPLEIRKQTNFDHPDAFDWPLFEQQIADLRKGHPIEQPTYSYLVCTRLPETVRVEPKEVIIVEGIMSLYDKELRDLMDLKIFVDAEPDERLLRVITRDMVERGHPLEMLIDKYRNILKPMHDEFIEPTKQYADIIIPNGGNNQKAIEILKLYIEKILGR